MEVWWQEETVSGITHLARERFTVSGGTRTVSSVGVRIRRVVGSSPLVLRLETSGGTSFAADSAPVLFGKVITRGPPVQAVSRADVGPCFRDRPQRGEWQR